MPTDDRLEMRLPPEVKAQLRRAADARGVSLTRFALDALTRAAEEVLNPSTRTLGWAAGTAVETGDIVAPATGPDEWEALR